jgi:hypothetical protein
MHQVTELQVMILPPSAKPPGPWWRQTHLHLLIMRSVQSFEGSTECQLQFADMVGSGFGYLSGNAQWAACELHDHHLSSRRRSDKALSRYGKCSFVADLNRNSTEYSRTV